MTSGSPPRPASRLQLAAVALAVALPIALGSAELHVVPTAHGLWRGIAEPPQWPRLVLASALGLATAFALRRRPANLGRPLLWLGLAGAPLVPLLSGRLLGLLVFQQPALVLLCAAAVAVVLLRACQAAGSGAEKSALSAGRPGLPDGRAGTRRDLLLLALGFLAYAWLGRALPGPAGPQGDEPHYLLMAHSLLHDGDLDLNDEFTRREYLSFFSGTLQAHTSPESPPGTIYPVHAPGLPALLLPAYALGGYPAAKLFVSFLAALVAMLVHRLVRLTFGGAALAFGVWVALALVPPLPLYAVVLYPETPAALATAVFLLTSRRDPGRMSLALAGVAAAALPWMHPKFLPLALVGLTLTVARRGPLRARAAAVLACVASVVALLFFFRWIYGHASLSAAYGPRFASDVSLARVPWGLGALFFDRQFGLVMLAPLWALALPGAALLVRERPGDALRAGFLAAASLGVGASFSMWWGGACPPGRFVVPALPALALALAAAFRRRPAAAAALVALGVALLPLVAGTPSALHNRADGQSGLSRFLVPSLDLDGPLPSFVLGGWPAPLLALTLAAAVALGWRFGPRGLVAGGLSYLLVAGALSDRPLVDERTSVARLLDAWDDARVRPISGALDVRALSLALDLPRAPWVLARGDVRRSRRVSLPPGLYRLEIDARPGPAPTAVHLARLEAQADELSLDWVYLRSDRPLPPLPLPLPLGAPRLALVASGVADDTLVAGARLVPLALVPRRLRAAFPFLDVLEPDRYRVGGDALRVSVLDRSQPEAGGFRLDGEQGAFVLESAPRARLRVTVRRSAPAAGDALFWFEREIALSREAQATLTLPNEGGVRLGDEDVLPVRLKARDAWVRFDPENPR